MKDFLWLHIRDLPYFRSLLRAVEARYYQSIELPEPVYDLGCGDGHFASLTFDQPLEVGLDPWSGPIHEAAGRKVYHGLVQADGSQAPFPDNHFASAISNSVLEHIPHIDATLKETARILRPGGRFVFCVPNHQFEGSLGIGRALDQIGLRGLGDRYRAFFQRIARHVHCDPPEVWQKRLEAAGLEVERYWHYYSPKAMQVSEWGHYLGLPSLVTRKLTGRWILAPTRWNLGLTYRLLKPYYDATPETPEGVCTFYVARKM